VLIWPGYDQHGNLNEGAERVSVDETLLQAVILAENQILQGESVVHILAAHMYHIQSNIYFKAIRFVHF
jgi:hypothetical protein